MELIFANYASKKEGQETQHAERKYVTDFLYVAWSWQQVGHGDGISLSFPVNQGDIYGNGNLELIKQTTFWKAWQNKAHIIPSDWNLSFQYLKSVPAEDG